MDRFAVARSKTTTTTTTRRSNIRRTKKKAEKGIKVVYISNPMKVKASASEFRALVQELTGQDSDPAELIKFLDLDRPDAAAAAANYGDYQARPAPPSMVPVLPDMVQPETGGEASRRDDVDASSTYPFDLVDDDVFTPQMVESFNGFFPSSIFYHESQMEMLRGLDAL